MKSLLEAVSALVAIVSPERTAALAAAIRPIEAASAGSLSNASVLSSSAVNSFKAMVAAWRSNPVAGETLAAMLLAADHAYRLAENRQTVELVWTGPTTEIVPARRTEQALVQVINLAMKKLFITSYVAYDIESVAQALKGASARGVTIEFLMELSKADGGKVTSDPMAHLRKIVPQARFYIWKDKDAAFVNGCVHAKVAVADGFHCFITSANLTGYAMDQNMEAGVLISGAPLPDQLHRHLDALVVTGVVVSVE
ncbi:MAG: DISARM system phospholipase D-like protein DrmC [Pseudomonadaceae bacterium]|nr:DISARM system phospholipase D-like protein DrmC [Pseudomonadaceae bacterium]